MPDPLRNMLRRFRYGDPVVVVSGLPRSGTSLLMSMLEAGGLPVVTDHVREADEDNPKGYFEFEKVKALGETDDKSWVRSARGKGLKVISHLLKELPKENYYRIVFAKRDLEEVIASQNIMLDRKDETNPVDDAKAIKLYRTHLVNVRFLVRRSNNLEMLELAYSDTIKNPVSSAELIDRFLGGTLDTRKMSAVVDESLYRNRKNS